VAPFDNDAGSTYHVDLGDPLGRAIEIISAGRTLTDSPPAKFRRQAIALPLPVPESGGSLEALRPFVNIGSDQDFKLFIAVLAA
jgi:putative DNA primase/helicase